MDPHAIITDNEARWTDDDFQPRRPRASPRPTPRRSRTPDPEEEDVEPGDSTSSSGRESPLVRGRTGWIGAPLKQDELPPSASVRRRAGPSSIDVDDHRCSHRLMSKDLSASPEELDSSILESYPTGEVNLNVAEILSEASGTVEGGSVGWSGFAGHRDTFGLVRMHGGLAAAAAAAAVPRRSLGQPPGLPRTFFRRLGRHVDFDTYLSIRLSCRCWSAAISSVRPPRFATGASVLPVEIIQRICAQLSPIDFNAARHICRAWMLASLRYELLVQMLQSGGWWSAARADITLMEEGSPRRMLGREWLLSKRLSTECSLRADWMGNGLSGGIRDGSTPSVLEPASNPTNSRLAFESFTLDSEVEFSAALSSDRHAADEKLDASGSRFTFSVCGRYLLVTEDCTIYIYSLNSHASITDRAQSLSPIERLTNLVCPHRVLAVSMDTSSSRFAVAALLQDRVGLVYDLGELGAVSHRSICDAYRWDPGFSALREHQDPVLANPMGSSGGAYDGRFSAPVAPGPTETLSQRKSSDYSTDAQPPPYPSATRSNMPVVPELSSVFYHLGSGIDSPVSVAICAQRRCVAFGCSGAVELHWVDAFTGQGLNRRFSIPAGGEILYFFPERKEGRKMRLVGSGAVPAVGGVAGEGGQLESARANLSAAGRIDYYNAIPLSDGTHVLFADRTSAQLCLGIETPPTTMTIDAGYLRLETRVIFDGPLMENGNRGRTVPRIYETARDLRWGGRVVVGFGDEVWVFAVPGDALKERRAGERGNKNEENEDDDGETRTSVLRIGGVRVGEVESLAAVDICADGGGVLVRGIGRAGLFKEWRLTGRAENVKRWVVQNDGSVVAREDKLDEAVSGAAAERDADGDVVMRDYIPRDSSSCYHDGEVMGSESAHYDDDDDDDGEGGVAIEFDLDGDVIMQDVGVCYGGGRGEEEDEEHLDEGYISDDTGLGWGT
ncbi:hypothetical protein MMC29_004284, partial [Sticta canariensis]|nr:hypothetical protein [Sticta canariensis]